FGSRWPSLYRSYPRYPDRPRLVRDGRVSNECARAFASGVQYVVIVWRHSEWVGYLHLDQPVDAVPEYVRHRVAIAGQTGNRAGYTNVQASATVHVAGCPTRLGGNCARCKKLARNGWRFQVDLGRWGSDPWGRIPGRWGSDPVGGLTPKASPKKTQLNMRLAGSLYLAVVPRRGLEPPHLAAHGPEPCAS